MTCGYANAKCDIGTAVHQHTTLPYSGLEFGFWLLIGFLAIASGVAIWWAGR